MSATSLTTFAPDDADLMEQVSGVQAVGLIESLEPEDTAATHDGDDDSGRSCSPSLNDPYKCSVGGIMPFVSA